MDCTRKLCYNYSDMRKLYGSKLKKFNKRNKPDRSLVFILDNIEYARNTAGIFNLAYALKVEKIFLTGITATPPFGKELSKVSRHKEESIHWEKHNQTTKVIEKLRNQNFSIISVGKTENSLRFSEINHSQLSPKVAIIVGNEKQALSNSLLEKSDFVVHAPVYRPLAHLNIINELAVVAYNLV